MKDLPRRKALQMSAIAIVSGIAGCASRNSSPSPSKTDTDSTSPTDSSTPTETPIPREQITEYESLTDRGQDLFQTLLSQDSIEKPTDRIPTKLWEAEYVRHEGDVYSISKTDTDRSIAEYTLYSSSTKKTEVDNAELVAYPDLSAEAKDAFKQTLNEGEYTVRGETLPGKLDEARFVKYDGNYYELRVTVADIRVWTVSITKVRG